MFGRKTFSDTLIFSARVTKRTRKNNRNMGKACSKLSLAISGCLKEKLWTNLGIFFFNLHFFFITTNLKMQIALLNINAKLLQ